MMNKKGQTMELCAIVFLIIAVLVFIANETHKDTMNEIENHCIKEGWDGAEYKHNKQAEYRCYKSIEHSSGVGIETVYSGLINPIEVK